MRHFILAIALAPLSAFAQTAEEIAAMVEQFQQETLAFAESVGACVAFEQAYMVAGTGQTLDRSVEGETDGICTIVFEAIDPEGRNLRCRLDAYSRAVFSNGWTEAANNVLPDGSYKVSYPSDTPDDVRNVMSSAACVVDNP
ncbi:hypothetical protein [Cognatiyoonia sp. IB215182]|uniref:hypothetical protein n=1 Tax=Cognatiyoonia sp. IB215182 TaxID=3097353 RepID=UPI002A0BEE7A|nr:hypothetical protein [Cognatiyoonia sp. IB215182]MDX8354305.1 hypothetical protein [Cognatiyoonia sp. IB215182]